jgi:hypothetical protein
MEKFEGRGSKMNENLSQMIKEFDTNVPPTIPPEVSEVEQVVEEKTEATTEEATEQVATPDPIIEVTQLGTWFAQRESRFETVKAVNISVRDVDQNRDLVVTIPDVSGRRLKIIENANVQPVLNLDGLEMWVYNNGFEIVYEFNGPYYLKGYGFRTGLIVVYCAMINGLMIPYKIGKAKKKDEGIPMYFTDIDVLTAKLGQPIDREALELRYKQSAKAHEQFATNQDAITWLLNRTNDITDVNHLLQIDNVIIQMLTE